ncbi:MAG: sigma factor [Candidatus Omnitrophota bacterium]
MKRIISIILVFSIAATANPCQSYALRPIASVNSKETPLVCISGSSYDEVKARIVDYKNTGLSLREGDKLITASDSQAQKTLTSNGVIAYFSFTSEGEKAKNANIVFLGEYDPNHSLPDEVNNGLLLNFYYLDDYNKEYIEQPFCTYKFYAEKGKAVQVNLPSMDVLAATYGLREIETLARPYITKILKGGIIQVSCHRHGYNPYPPTTFNIPPKKFKNANLLYKDVAVVVENDKNHGQVINIYLKDDYYAKKNPKPLVTYKHFKDISPIEGKDKWKTLRSKTMQINLAKHDILKAHKGIELQECGRIYKTTIKDGGEGCGVCVVPFINEYRRDDAISFFIKKDRMGEGALLNEPAIIKVEKDINQRQVINIYLESEYEKSTSPKPLATYKSMLRKIRHCGPGIKLTKCRQVDLAFLDAIDCYNGRYDIKPVKDRILELTVRRVTEKDGTVRYEASKTMSDMRRKDSFDFALYPIAKGIFKDKKMPQKALGTVENDPSYGPYEEIWYKTGKEKVVVARHYYLDNFPMHMPIDFSKIAFLDYVLCNKDIYGGPVAPREYYHPYVVPKNGIIKLAYRNRWLEVRGLKSLAGKKPAFVPVEDVKHGWKVYVYDAGKYSKNKKSRPKITLIRNAYFKKLIPISQFTVKFAQELLERGILEPAIDILQHTAQRHKKRSRPAHKQEKITVTTLLNTADRLKKDRLQFLENKTLPFKDRGVDFYLVLLADAIYRGKKADEDKNKVLTNFRQLMQLSPEQTTALIEQLIDILDFNSEHESQIYLNTAILCIINELPEEYKEEEDKVLTLAKAVCKFVSYEGRYQDKLRKEGKKFFESIPEKHAFIPNGKSLPKKQSKEIPDPVAQHLARMYDFSMLTPLGEIKYGVLAQIGDTAARNKLVESNLRLEYSIAKSYAWSYNLPLEELLGPAHDGLMKAAKEFKPQKGYRFSTFAVKIIKQIIDSQIGFYLNDTKISSYIYNQIKEFKRRCQVKDINPISGKLTIPEIASAIDMSETKVTNVINYMKYSTVLLSTPLGNEDEGYTIESTIADDKIEDLALIQDKIFEAIGIVAEKLFKKWREYNVHKFNRMVTTFIKRILPMLGVGETETLQEIGEDYDVTRETIRLGENTMEELLAEELKKTALSEDDFEVFVKNVDIESELCVFIQELVGAYNGKSNGKNKNSYVINVYDLVNGNKKAAAIAQAA